VVKRRGKELEPRWRAIAEYPIRSRLFHSAAGHYVDFIYSLALAPIGTSHYGDGNKRPLNRFLIVEFCADFERSCRDGIGDDDKLWDDLKTYLLQIAELTDERVPEKTKQQIVLRVGRLLMQRRIDERYFVRIKRKLPA
jgi:hypothetical protein